jgi:hypothetical protein
MKFVSGLFLTTQNEANGMKKLVLQKILLQQTESQHVFVRDMLRNGTPRVCFYFFHGRNSKHFSPLRNGSGQNSESFLFRGMFRREFQEFASIFVPYYRIPSILLLCGTVRNRIPRVFCSTELPEFRRNKPIVPSVPSSAEYFFLSEAANLPLPTENNNILGSKCSLRCFI